MTKRIGSIYVAIAAAAVAAAPALAPAQSQQEQQEQQTEQGRGQPAGQQQQQQKQEQQKQEQQKQEQQKQAQKGAKKMTLNERISFAVANGCQYTANVNGTISPAKGGSAQQQQQQQAQHLVTSELQVNSMLSCPGKPTVRVDETAVRTGPITQEALEEAIERRATILIEETGGRRCAFMPDFEFGEQRLTGVAVAYLCASAPQQQQGQLDQSP
jgi:hypothetical protein